MSCVSQTEYEKVTKKSTIDKSIVEIDTINHKINEMRYSEEIHQVKIQIYIPQIKNQFVICQNLEKYRHNIESDSFISDTSYWSYSERLYLSVSEEGKLLSMKPDKNTYPKEVDFIKDAIIR